MKCPKCGAEIINGDKFCMNCGTPVDNMTISNANSQYTGNSSTGMYNDSNTNLNDTMSSDAYTPNSNNYIQNNYSNDNMIGPENKVDVAVRRYFFGYKDIIPLSIIAFCLGPVTCGVGFVVGTIGLIFAIVLSLYTFLLGGGADKVDQASSKAVNVLKQRAIKNFNVDLSQISEIEPITVVGVGNSPDNIYFGADRRIRIFRLLGNFVSKLMLIRSIDPMEGLRFGSDRVVRYLLVQVTVYAFTDTRLLTYTGNMDIATGVIYDESVTDTFYSDINSLTFNDVLRRTKTGIFRKEYYVSKYINLDVCGITKVACFDSRFASNGLASATNSLEGMKSYIRDKKS